MTETISTQNNNTPLPLVVRIVLFSISYIVLTGFFQIIGLLLADVPIGDLSVVPDVSIHQNIILQLFCFVSLIIIVYIFRKFVDKKSFKSLGFSFKNRAIDVASGFIVALVIMGGGSLILYFMGYIEFSNFRLDLNVLLLTFVLYFFVSLYEEILVRGYLLNNLMTSMNKYIALLITSLLFAMLHLFNSNISLIGFLNLFIAGLLLGLTYIFSKKLLRGSYLVKKKLLGAKRRRTMSRLINYWRGYKRKRRNRA